MYDTLVSVTIPAHFGTFHYVFFFQLEILDRVGILIINGQNKTPFGAKALYAA